MPNRVLVVVALCMTVLLGFMVGLGIDLGYPRYKKRQVQKAADVQLAMAGARQTTQCPAGTFDCTAVTTAAQAALTENGLTGSSLVTGCGSGSGTLVVTVEQPSLLREHRSSVDDTHYVEAGSLAGGSLCFSSYGIRPDHRDGDGARRGRALGSSVSCIYALDPSKLGFAGSGLRGCRERQLRGDR